MVLPILITNMTATPHWNFKDLILKEIKQNGGFVNAHAHIDRAFTITPDSLDIYRKHTLEEKWDLVDAVKDASEEVYYKRISQGLELMISQGVTAVGSFIDIDPIAEDRAAKAAVRAKNQYKSQIAVVLINQVLKGVIEPGARKWFDRAMEYVDIVGGLPKRDERDYGKGAEHIDILLSSAKKYGKMAHIHVDQFNTQKDKETELLADKTIEHGMQGRVVAVHSISLASHPQEYREKVYAKLKKAEVMVIGCPTAWIDAPRHEELQPFHNALTPVDELVKHGITVAIGSDNIADYMLPFTDGDMWNELKLMAIGNRFMNLDELVKIATVNGRKVLGLSS
jgi:cytosine/adenosine deaminase-related metal-dependent hydrolase